ncbi:MAG: hypothetical protein ACRC2H_02795 [Silanimonas sp.]
MNAKLDNGRASLRMRVSGNRVSVSAPRDHLYDLKKFGKLQEIVLGKLGHLACISGFDIRWRHFEEIVLPG